MNPVEKDQPGMTSSQARVLGVLRDEGRPTTLAELAVRTGLHANTLRGHLDALVRGGRVSRIAVRHGGRGRPAWAYLARESEYAALAFALAEGLDSSPDSPAESAPTRGGRAWGERLRAQLAPEGEGAELSPRDRLLLALEHTGFAPEADGKDVRLHACPLLDAARSHPGVVCAAHLGLVEGVLGQTGARLQPHPETLGCVVTLP